MHVVEASQKNRNGSFRLFVQFDTKPLSPSRTFAHAISSPHLPRSQPPYPLPLLPGSPVSNRDGLDANDKLISITLEQMAERERWLRRTFPICSGLRGSRDGARLQEGGRSVACWTVRQKQGHKACHEGRLGAVRKGTPCTRVAAAHTRCASLGPRGGGGPGGEGERKLWDVTSVRDGQFEVARCFWAPYADMGS